MSLSSSESLLTEDGVICQSDYTEVCTYILPLSLLSNDPLTPMHEWLPFSCIPV